MFEIPAKSKLSVSLSGSFNLEEEPWKIGLIVGPSGSGKTLLLDNLFGGPELLNWWHKSVIDDFPDDKSMEEISRVCQSVGFNTIPSWLRPYSVLSNGEKFRVEVARRLLWPHGVICIDEFTSVVDRQVACFACHAIQKYIREQEHKQLVVASCHYDIINWLQPDWILEPGNPCRFTWRSLQRRPPIECQVSRVKYETWQLFRDFHYMSQDLNKAARCYGLYVSSPSAAMEEKSNIQYMDSHSDGSGSNLGVSSGSRIPSAESSNRARDSDVVFQSDNNSSVYTTEKILGESLHDWQIGVVSSSRPNTSTYRIASMCGVLYRPHPKVSDIMGFTRMVTLPDFQGLGLAFVLANTVASAYRALGKRLHSYPNHPAWIRSYQRSKNWMQVKEAGSFSPSRGKTSTVGGFGGRRCAVFQYIGDAMNVEEARRLVDGD